MGKWNVYDFDEGVVDHLEEVWDYDGETYDAERIKQGIEDEEWDDGEGGLDEDALRTDIELEVERWYDNKFWDAISEHLDRECIYTATCFEICQALNYSDWSSSELFESVNSIDQAAYSALYEHVGEEYDKYKNALVERICDNALAAYRGE